MKTLRINLHLRSDTASKLFDALVDLPPRPRAEFLRKIAEIGLQCTLGQSTYTATAPHSELARHHGTREHSNETFGDDLASVLGDNVA